MKTLRIIMAIIALGLCACTHNNGDIGPWFGQWKLEALEADGEPVAEYGGNIFWAFQSDVLLIDEIMDDGLQYVMHTATWRHEGDKLIIDFRHSDSSSPSTDGNYAAPAILGLQPRAVNTLTVEKLSSGHITLKYDSGGKCMTYRLRKWG